MSRANNCSGCAKHAANCNILVALPTGTTLCDDCIVRAFVVLVRKRVITVSRLLAHLRVIDATHTT